MQLLRAELLVSAFREYLKVESSDAAFLEPAKQQYYCRREHKSFFALKTDTMLQLEQNATANGAVIVIVKRSQENGIEDEKWRKEHDVEPVA